MKEGNCSLLLNLSMAWTETMKKTDLMDLPGDIILDILKRLPVKTLCSLRCVSKILLNKLDDPLIFNLLTTTDAAAEIPLQLTSLTTRYRSKSALRGRRIEMQAMKYDGNALAAEENKHAPRNFACVKSFYDFDFCYYNLFFFSVASAEHPCFLSNPLRGEVLKLPVNEFLKENIVYRYGSYGMGFDTITNNHKIICVTSSVSEDDLEARVLVLGTSSWKEIPSLPPCYLGQDKICAHGDMHWLSDSERFCRQIISFDFTKEEFYLTPLPTSIPSDVLPYIHLLTWRGSIAIAYASYLDMSIKIWVLKNYETKEWASAPDHSISIGTYVATKRYGFWPRLFAHEWEHGIFFMDELGENMFFSDLRGGCNKFPTGSCSRKHAYVEIVGYAWSFMSLKHYGQLEVEDVAEVEKYQMLPSFLKQFGQCFIGVKKTESVKQRVWQLA